MVQAAARFEEALTRFDKAMTKIWVELDIMRSHTVFHHYLLSEEQQYDTERKRRDLWWYRQLLGEDPPLERQYLSLHSNLEYPPRESCLRFVHPNYMYPQKIRGIWREGDEAVRRMRTFRKSEPNHNRYFRNSLKRRVI